MLQDALKLNIKQCNVDQSALSSDTQDRSSLENSVPRSSQAVRRLASRSSGTQKSSPEGGSTSQQLQRLVMWQYCCSHVCSSKVGLHAHQQTHRWQAIRRFERAVYAV